MKKTKYELYGAYHWAEYAKCTTYGIHANLVSCWVGNYETGRILDVGAGDGLIAHLLGAEGIDIDPLAVELARERGVDVSLGDICSIPRDDKSYDAITCLDVIEHIEEAEQGLAEIKRVLTSDGQLFLTTPPRPAEGMHDPEWHVWERTPDEMLAWLAANDFSPTSCTVVVPAARMYIRALNKEGACALPECRVAPTWQAVGATMVDLLPCSGNNASRRRTGDA